MNRLLCNEDENEERLQKDKSMLTKMPNANMDDKFYRIFSDYPSALDISLHIILNVLETSQF